MVPKRPVQLGELTLDTEALARAESTRLDETTPPPCHEARSFLT
jgi:hypothetical protein